MIRGLALLCAALAALLPAACGEAPRAARPALWRVRDADTTLWLLGSIHLLPEGVRWEAGPVAAAIRDADTLVTEVPAGDPRVEAATFLRLGRAAGLPPIAARVAGAGEARGYDRLKSWAAALAIGADAARGVGASREAGVEAVLARRFAGRGHAALESFAGQLGLFDALPEGAQRRLLAGVLAERRDARAAYARTLEAWARGDEAAILANFDAILDPVLRTALVTARNRRWAARLAARMARPGTVLVAVGAGHLVGREGVPELLRARGFRVERVQ